jgi:hypothetical protein
MKRTLKIILRAVGVLAAVPAALAGLSGPAMAWVVVVVVVALCWIIADAGRSNRLTKLIRASRGTVRMVGPPPGTASPSRQRPARTKKRRR